MKNSDKREEDGCVKCGTCNTVCPVYLTTGNEVHTPRGKQHLGTRLQKGERSAHYADIFSKCLLCGACLEVCPRGLDTPQLVMDVRSELPRISGHSFLKYISRKALVHPGLLAGLARAGKAASNLLGDILPQESGLRLRLMGFDRDVLQLPPQSYMAGINDGTVHEKKAVTVNYFTGCLANYLQPEIAESTQFLVSKTMGGPARVSPGQTCCGMAALAAGREEEALDLAKKNIKAFEDNDLPILTSCSSCYFQLKTYNDLFADDREWQERAKRFTERLQEFSTFFLEKISENSEKRPIDFTESSAKRVFYHDPCHLRFKLHITEEPRQLLGLFPGIILAELPGGSQCCGQGGLFQVAHPDLALQILDRLLDEHGKLGADTVVTACSGCLLQWQLGLGRGNSNGRAEHLAVFIARLMR